MHPRKILRKKHPALGRIFGVSLSLEQCLAAIDDVARSRVTPDQPSLTLRNSHHVDIIEALFSKYIE